MQRKTTWAVLDAFSYPVDHHVEDMWALCSQTSKVRIDQQKIEGGFHGHGTQPSGLGLFSKSGCCRSDGVTCLSPHSSRTVISFTGGVLSEPVWLSGGDILKGSTHNLDLPSDLMTFEELSSTWGFLASVSIMRLCWVCVALFEASTENEQERSLECWWRSHLFCVSISGSSLCLWGSLVPDLL